MTEMADKTSPVSLPVLTIILERQTIALERIAKALERLAEEKYRLSYLPEQSDNFQGSDITR